MVEQLAIAFCGLASVYLSQDTRRERRKWACVFGLAAQPFWFATAWDARQFGVLALCFVYAWLWVRGFRLYWFSSGETAAGPRQISFKGGEE
jgi:hypothetical protein